MLSQKAINKYRKKFDDDKTNKIKQRMMRKTPLIDLIQDDSIETKHEFNLNIKTHGVTDQQSSGRCWEYAGLNILRERVIEKLNLENFELSASYIAYYDKLEKFNLALERLIIYRNNGKDLYDRYVSTVLKNGIIDGGFFTQFAHLISKYGIVPKNVFPETFAYKNPFEMNQILLRLLRKFYLELEKNEKEITELKEEYMEKAYTVISNLYGIPKESFDFEYTDKQGNYHIDKNITPKEFYKKYINIDLVNDYVEITSYNDEKVKYDEVYKEETSSMTSGMDDTIMLNINKSEFEKLIIEQLKNKELVYFYCTTHKRTDGIMLDTLKRYGELFNMDLELDNNSHLKTNGITGCHTMIITGANIIDNVITKYKIEDSYGSKMGKSGYWVATKDWADKYIYRIVINKKYLTKKQLKILTQKPIVVATWDCKF